MTTDPTAAPATMAGSTWHDRAASSRITATGAVVDGEARPARSGATMTALSARDGRPLASVAACRAEDVDDAVRAARRAFDSGVWSRADPRRRRRVLLDVADAVAAHADELALLETLEVGKPIGDTTRVDVPTTVRTLRWYAEAVDKRYDEIAPAPRRALALVTREPVGVVGAVVPWNYPLIIAAWKIAPALATGNSVVLKPAEQSSLATLRLVEIAHEAGLPRGVLSAVPGTGPEAGAALGRHPDVDKVTFTGSTEVGRLFLGYAAESNGKQVALETGGKSPHVVLGDVGDVGRAAAAVAWGVFYNAGQTCHAGSRLLVHESVHDELLDAVVEVGRSLRLGDPLDPRTQVGALVSEEQGRRVLGHVSAAAAAGSRLVAGGERVRPEPEPGRGPGPAGGGVYVQPTVFDDVDPASALAQEEVFGPVLAATAFRSVDEAVAVANGTRYGLAAAVWTRDVATAHATARRLRAGTVWVNTFDAADVVTPFGGFRDSGSGRDRSLHAMDAYTSLKTTWVDLGPDPG